MAGLTLYLLGHPQVRAADRDVRLPSVKAQALLFYLAAQPERPFTRSHLCALLWEESSEAEGRNSLSTALSRLRSALPLFPISADADTLMWEPASDVWVDSQAFVASSRGEVTPPLHPQPTSTSLLVECADLWRGPFLDGFTVRDSLTFDEWLRQMRETWEQRYLALLWRIVEAAQTTHDWPLIQTIAQRALQVDPLQERFYRARMVSLYQTGDRAAALAQYDDLAAILVRELGAPPDPSTIQLFESIRDGTLDRAPLVRSVRRPAPLLPRPSAPPAYSLLERQADLDRLWAHLSATDSRRRTADGSRPVAVAGQLTAVDHGQLVVLTGEAGIGKSRLFDEVVWRLSHGDPPGWTVLHGHCYEAERSLPYHPFVEALTPLIGTLDLDSLDVPAVWLAEVARLLPDLATRPDLIADTHRDQQQDQRRLFEGIARFLGALPAPLLIILDDLHWADAATLQLLAYLVRHLAQHPILFVGAVRSEDMDEALESTLRRLEREGRLDKILLQRLSATATTALLREMVRTDMDTLGARLYQETEGNPLFTVEIVRSLMEAGALESEGRLPRGRMTLPATVVAVIQARLARLSPAGRELLAAASIFRRDFDFEMLQQTSGQTEDDALDALDELLRAQLLVERVQPKPIFDQEPPHLILLKSVASPADPPGFYEPGETADDARYAFSHDKVREVVYNSLSHARRTTLHRRAVAALGAPTNPRAAERVAYHARLGRLWEESLQWSWVAAEGAKAVFAFTSAADLYQQALECLAHLPQDDGHRRQAIMMRLHLSRVAFYIYPARLIEWLAPAEADALLLGDEMLLSFVWLAQGAALYIQGEFHAARPRLERLLPLVESTGDATQTARTRNILGRLLALQGSAPHALPLLLDAAHRLDALGQHNDALISRGMVGAERAFRGDFTHGLREATTVYAESLKQADLAAIGAAAVFVGAVHHAWGQWAEAETWSRRALSYVQQAANVVYERNVYLFLGLPLTHQGDLAGGQAALERAIALGAECQSRVFMGRAHAWLAETLLLAGDLERARQAAEHGRAIAQATEAHYDLAVARRVLGQVMTAQGAWTEASAELTAVISAFQSLGAQPEVGRSLAHMARLAYARGHHEQAAFWRTQAADIFSRLAMHWDLAQLDRL